MQAKKSTKHPLTFSEIVKKLTQRFNYDKIINEQHYIKNMSTLMMINIQILAQDQIFKDKQSNNIQEIIMNVPFFKIVKNCKYMDGNYVKIQYQNSEKILVIAGIKKDIVKQWVQLYKKQKRNYHNIVKDINLGYWHTIEFSNSQTAMNAKKFFRNKKVQQDLLQSQQNIDIGYKFPGRRVRIVLISQDFFTILYDQLNETMHQNFTRSIQTSQPFNSYYYIPLYSGDRTEQKQQQYDDAFSSQFQSQTQSAYDNSVRMKQIQVQTANQGTQVGVQMQVNQNQDYINNGNNNGNNDRNNNGSQGLGFGFGLGEEERERGKEGEWYGRKIQESFDSERVQVVPVKNQRNLSEKNQNQNHRHSLSQMQAHQKLNVINRETQITKTRTNSACFPSIVQSGLSLQKNQAVKVPKKSKKNKKDKKYNEHSLEIKHKLSQKKYEPQTPTLPQYSRLEFLEVKSRLNEYKKQLNGLPKPDIPQCIRRQSQNIIYKHKFHQGIFRNAQKIRIQRVSSYI